MQIPTADSLSVATTTTRDWSVGYDTREFVNVSMIVCINMVCLSLCKNVSMCA